MALRLMLWHKHQFGGGGQAGEPSGLTHVDAAGRAQMVDVSQKAATKRTAAASARVQLTPAAFEAVQTNSLKKGDVLTAAQIAGERQALGRLCPESCLPLTGLCCHRALSYACAPAGVMGAKQTAALIPLCHNIFLSKVDVRATLQQESCSLLITAEASTTSETGVEMEALTGAAVAALTVYDMCKAVDKSITIQCIQLDRKTGGKSGDYSRRE
eukprot:jgi/Astpho2/3890/Aster-04399